MFQPLEITFAHYKYIQLIWHVVMTHKMLSIPLYFSSSLFCSFTWQQTSMVTKRTIACTWLVLRQEIRQVFSTSLTPVDHISNVISADGYIIWCIKLTEKIPSSIDTYKAQGQRPPTNASCSKMCVPVGLQ